MSKKATAATAATVVPRFQVDPVELQARKDNAKAFYTAALEEPHRPGRGAVVKFLTTNIAEAAEEYSRLKSEGYELLPVQSPLPSFDVQYGLATIHLVKPLSVQEADLEVIYAEVEQAYRAELEAQRNAEIDRQVVFQLQAERRRALAEQSQKEADDRQRIRDEVAASIAGGKQ